MSTDKEHLQWIYDRLVTVYPESPRYDYMHRFRQIIDNMPVAPDVSAASTYATAYALQRGILTPEHSARPVNSDKFSEVEAAYRYVESVVKYAIDVPVSGGHAWHGWALREAFLAGCSHHAASNQYYVGTEKKIASPYAIELDETTAQVLTCPECSSTSVGFGPWPFGARTHLERRGNIEAEIFAFDFRCEDCGERWELQVEACTGQRGQALSLTLEIIPKAPCILPTFVTPSTPSHTLTGLLKSFF
jgi:hypothetical protein